MPPEADDKIMQNPGIWAFPWLFCTTDLDDFDDEEDDFEDFFE
jgi:hypothetical protein